MDRLRLPLFLIAAAALAVAPRAQTTALLIDDFEDGDLGEYELFAGAEEPTLSTSMDAAQGMFALQIAIDADDYGDFAGFFRPLPGAPVDMSGFDDAFLVFDLDAADGTVEINFQDGDGETGGEIRSALQLSDTDGYKQFALPIRTFANTRATAFDPTAATQIVFTVIDATGDGDSGTQESISRLDNVRIVTDVATENTTVFDDFDDADFAEYFSFAGGEFPELAPTDDTPSGSGSAIRIRIDADEYNGFAGFGKTIDGAPVDISDTDALNFTYKANGAGALEVNVQSGAADNNAGTQFEGRETVLLADTGDEFKTVSIPLAALIQTRAERPDFTDVYNVVFTFVRLETADSDPGTQEFQFIVDDVGFGSVNAGSVAVEVPPSLAAAPAVFPNPTAGAATVAFDVVAPTGLRVDVLDVLGRRVATLADGPAAPGAVRLAVPTGTLVPGTYLVRVWTDAGLAAVPMTVVR